MNKMLTQKYFKNKEDAKKYLRELLNKKYFQAKGIDYLNRVVRTIAKDDAMQIRSSANYWKTNEGTRRNFGDSID